MLKNRKEVVLVKNSSWMGGIDASAGAGSWIIGLICDDIP